MNEEDLKILAEEVVEFCSGLEALAVKFRTQVEKLFGENKRRWSWNPNKIKWVKTQGAKGEFEKSEDYNNPEFKALLKDLASHNGKLTCEGWFYWTYKNGSTVGRKRKEAKG